MQKVCTGLLVFMCFVLFGCAGTPENSMSISIVPGNATVDAGGSHSFTATVSNDLSSGGVTWSVMCSDGNCGSISPASTASGVATVYTAPTTAPSSNLTVMITATSATDRAKSASSIITVPPVGISVSPTTATVEATKTQQFAATFSGAANQNVTWSATCTASDCGSFSNSTSNPATYIGPTAPPSTNLAVTITATSAADSSKSATSAVTVPAIALSVSPAMPTLAVNATQNFTVTINDDPTGAGVTWTLTQKGAACSPACGTLSNVTASVVTYTAPNGVPNPAAVTLVATSVTDTTKNSSATIRISGTGPAALLTGQYAFELGGLDTATVGSFYANGAGVITGGMYDNPNWGTNVTIASGSYTVGGDNRGTITFTDANNVSWQFAFALGSTSSGVATKGALIEMDGNNYNMTGFLELQDPNSFAAGYSGSGSYAFQLAGWDLAAAPQSIEGSASLSSTGAISSGLFDANDSGTVTTETAFTGTITMTTTGRGTITTTIPAMATIPGQAFGFVYAVDSTHLLVIYFNEPNNSVYWASLAGEIVQQSGDPYSASSLNGAVVLQNKGNDSSNNPEALVGTATLNSAGTFTYSIDQNDAGTIANQSGSGSFVFTDPSNGRFTFTPNGSDTLAGYMIAPSKAYITDITSGSQPTVGSFEPQSAGPFDNASMNGTDFVETLPLVSPTSGAALPTVISGVITFNDGSLSETYDANQITTLTRNQTDTDTYTVGSNGRVTTGSGKTVLYIVSPAPNPKAIVLDTAGSGDPNPWVQIMHP